MITNNRIALYGLNSEEREFIVRDVSTSGLALETVTCATDLIAINYIALIVFINALNKDELDMIIDFYEEIEIFSESVIFIGQVKLPKNLAGKIKVYPDFYHFQQNLKYIFLSAFRKAKKSENFSNSLSNAIKILSFIYKKPGITTKEMAEDLEISTRTVQRYIETLKIAGEWIEYDSSVKGWKLELEKSILFHND